MRDAAARRLCRHVCLDPSYYEPAKQNGMPKQAWSLSKTDRKEGGADQALKWDSFRSSEATIKKIKKKGKRRASTANTGDSANEGVQGACKRPLDEPSCPVSPNVWHGFADCFMVGAGARANNRHTASDT